MKQIKAMSINSENSTQMPAGRGGRRTRYMRLHQLAVVPIDPSAGVLAALAAIGFSFWNLHVVLLVLLVVGAGTADLLAGARRAHLREKFHLGEVYDKKKLDDGAWGKLFYLVLSLFFGMSGDSLVGLLGSGFDLGFADPFKALTPITAGALLYRFGKESASVMRNLEQTPGGKDQVWPIAKLIDTIRWEKSPGTTGPVPTDRWDDLTIEEREWLAEQLKAKRLPSV